MKDLELRGVVLQRFYDDRKGPKRNWSARDFPGLPWAEVARIGYQLKEKGLLKWRDGRNGLIGDGVIAEITAQGIDVIEGGAASPLPIQIVAINNSSHVQLGSGNVQDVKHPPDSIQPGDSLSDVEKVILREAAESGDLFLLHGSMHGRWVRSGQTDFISQEDPARQAIYLDGFDSLFRRSLIRHEGGHLYKLTGTGFAIARGIRAKD